MSTTTAAQVDYQVLFNIAVSMIMLLIGYIAHAARDAVRELKKSDAELAEKVHAIQLLVSDQYVKKIDFDRVAKEIFYKLDAIKDRLPAKENP